MSTILIQKESELKKILIQQAKEKTIIEKIPSTLKVEDFAGLSWMFLENGDDI